jgi:hypothetical protein
VHPYSCSRLSIEGANAKANRNQRGRKVSYGALKSNHHGKGGREHNEMPWLR